MRRCIALIIAIFCVAGLIGCSKERSVENTIDGNMKTYYEMSDLILVKEIVQAKNNK